MGPYGLLRVGEADIEGVSKVEVSLRVVVGSKSSKGTYDP